MNNKPVLLFLILFLVSGCVESYERIPPQKRLDDFYEKSIPEISLIPFLTEGGADLVPLLIADMQKKNTPKRRYIIAAVGELMDERALSTFVSIALDSSEEDHFRCDALKSIDRIKPKHLDILKPESKRKIENFIVECDKY